MNLKYHVQKSMCSHLITESNYKNIIFNGPFIKYILTKNKCTIILYNKCYKKDKDNIIMSITNMTINKCKKFIILEPIKIHINIDIIHYMIKVIQGTI